PEDVEAGRRLERFLDALRAVLQNLDAGEADAEDDRALGLGAAELLDDHLAEDAAALHRLLADVRRVDGGRQSVELDDPHAGVDELVEAAGHALALDRGGDALGAGIGEVLRQL